MKKQTKKLKILEICPFSAGICGVWARVLNEAREFTKLGFEVQVFSSNRIKGQEDKIAPEKESISNVNIRRFPPNADFLDRLISKNVTYFNFSKEFEEYSPDIVITHLLHPHSFKALALCKSKNIPCYLVTHAPFNVRRRFPLNILTSVYQTLMVKPKLNNFTKIIAITKWEMPYLAKLGVKKEKIFYIPNGVPQEFFDQEKAPSSKKILFLGRISPVKNIEYILKAAEKFPTVNFSIVGGAEEIYLKNLKRIVETKKLTNIHFYSPIYDSKEKIKIIDSHNIFLLPSKREAMPQVILEAMARGKIVIASKTDGSQELIEHEKNGFIFPIEKEEELFELIRKNIHSNSKIQKQAELTSRDYSWHKLIKSYVLLFNKLK
jgi:glycosyltransferase involved in cell wall biosynthesis